MFRLSWNGIAKREGVFKIDYEPESPNDGESLRRDEPESPNEGACV